MWAIGIGEAFVTETVGWATSWQAGLLLAIVAASTSLAIAEHVVRRLDAIRHPTPRQRAITAVCIAVAASGYLLFTGLRQHRDLFPKYHDENMHLVQMQLLAHRTLSSTSPPVGRRL